jgi:chromosomal replication initiation ATPase DnaA
MTLKQMAIESRNIYLGVGLLTSKPKISQTRDNIIRIIKEVCCEVYVITNIQMESMSRKREFVDCRNMVMMKIKEKIEVKEPITLKTIGKQFMGRNIPYDHSSVIHNIAAIKNLIDTDDDTRSKHELIEEKLGEYGI